MENRLQRKPRTHFGCDLSMAARHWLGDHDDCTGSIGFKGFCMAVATLWPWHDRGSSASSVNYGGCRPTPRPGCRELAPSSGASADPSGHHPSAGAPGSDSADGLSSWKCPTGCGWGGGAMLGAGRWSRSARSTLRPGNTFFAPGLPCAITLIGILRGGLSDRPLSIRRQRPVMMIFGLVSGRLTCW
jgi:hypothetical protein